jgi:predicted phage terminase large subunit-like protein
MVFRRRPSGLLQPTSNVVFDDRLLVDPQRLRNEILGLQIDSQQGGILKQVASGVALSSISYGLIQALREKHINVVDYKPKSDKEERLISQIDLFMGGSVLLPKEAPWLEAFVAELLSFPGRHDDQVDALAQGLAWRREAWKAPLVQRTTFGMTS